MKILGKTTRRDTTPTGVSADHKYAIERVAPVDAEVMKLSAYLDGQGPGSGEQVLRGFLIDVLAGTVAVTDPVAIEDNSEAAWLDLHFPTRVPLIAGRTYRMGLHANGAPQAARIYVDASADGIRAIDDYSDGTDASFGAGGLWLSEDLYLSPDLYLDSSSVIGEPALFATYITPARTPRPDEEDAYFARLAFPSAQRRLGDTAPDRLSRTSAICGWHGTWLDAEHPGSSFAIVQFDGSLAEMVGERIKVTTKSGRSVYAYVHRALDLDSGDELSLTRRLFQHLAPLATESLQVTVEVLGGRT